MMARRPRFRVPRWVPAPRRPQWTTRAAVLALAVLAVLAFGVAGLSKVRVETGLDSFFPSDDPAVTQLNELASSFGGDPVVALLESGQPRQLLDPQHLVSVVELEGRLAKLPDVAAVYGPGTTLNQIAARAQNFLAELSGRRDGVQAQAVAQARQQGASEARAAEAGRAALDAFDRRYGPLLVQGMPAGLPTLRNPQFVDSVVYTPDGVRPQWRFIVPSANSVAVLVRPRQGLDAAANQRLVDKVREEVAAAKLDAKRVTVSGVPAVAAALSGQVAGEVPLVGGIAVLAVGACFLLVPWTRWRRRLLPLLSTLIAIALTLAVFGWLGRPLSLGVVAFLSVLLGVGSYYPTYFSQHAKRRVVLVVSVATSASFATLMLSPLPFVRDLGMMLSVGVLVSAGVGLLLARRVAEEPRAPAPAPRPVPRRKAAVAAAGGAALVVAAAGWFALPGLPLSANFDSFAAGLPAMDDARHVEQVIGSSGELDVVLRGQDAASPAALDWMNQAQRLIVTEHGDRMRPVISLPSLLTFVGDRPTGDQIDAALRLLPPYLSSAVVRDDRKVAVLSFGVKIDDVAALRELRDDVLRTLPAPPAGYQVELTGLPMVAVRGEEMVSGDRVLANMLGIVAAGSVLGLGLRRRSDAARAVAGAVLATGLGLFVLWVIGLPLSPITVALGSLTAAVGCEFTVLLAESARAGNRALRRSILLATATSAVGYAALAGSRLAAIREFGLLLGGAVVLAVASAACVVWLTTRGNGTESGDTGESVSAEGTLAGVR